MEFVWTREWNGYKALKVSELRYVALSSFSLDGYCTCCGIQNRYTEYSKASPPFKSTDGWIKDRTLRGDGSPSQSEMGRVARSVARVPRYLKKNPEPAVWPCTPNWIKAQTPRYGTQLSTGYRTLFDSGSV